jgi:hypothetical protein
MKQGICFLTVYLFSPSRQLGETVTETTIPKLDIRER